MKIHYDTEKRRKVDGFKESKCESVILFMRFKIERWNYFMASKYDGLARIIMQNVGGTENVEALTHCVTRLRFKLKDEKKANTDVLKETEGIVTVIQNSEQYMVVIGNHVPDVYDAVVKRGHLENIPEDNSLENEEKK